MGCVPTIMKIWGRTIVSEFKRQQGYGKNIGLQVRPMWVGNIAYVCYAPLGKSLPSWSLSFISCRMGTLPGGVTVSIQ